jgi:hypothetical protein
LAARRVRQRFAYLEIGPCFPLSSNHTFANREPQLFFNNAKSRTQGTKIPQLIFGTPIALTFQQKKGNRFSFGDAYNRMVKAWQAFTKIRFGLIIRRKPQ